MHLCLDVAQATNYQTFLGYNFSIGVKTEGIVCKNISLGYLYRGETPECF